MSKVHFDPGPPIIEEGGRKVMLATPSYGSPSCAYTFSMASSREALHREGIPTAYLLLEGNCHVDDSRNSIVREFLVSDCTELVFLDADVSWKPSDLLDLCRFDCDLVGGVYPYRRDDDGETLPVRGLIDPHVKDGLVEVEGLPTGFMRIRRHVLSRMAEMAPKFRGRGNRGAALPLIFERDIHGDSRRGGDIHFCMKWRELGGKVHAACDLVLGHSGSMVVHDSLAAWLRRKSGLSLPYMVEQIDKGKATPELFSEAMRYVGNEKFAAKEDVLSLCALVKSEGPIIEAGSGLSTIVLAAANPEQTVYCLEHDMMWAERVKRLAFEAGTRNIAICRQRIHKGWYDLSDLDGELPESFGVGLNDGPPRDIGSRMGFFFNFGERTQTIICDDADDPSYLADVSKWSRSHARDVEVVGERGVLIRRKP